MHRTDLLNLLDARRKTVRYADADIRFLQALAILRKAVTA